jgi:hypothetical protein
MPAISLPKPIAFELFYPTTSHVSEFPGKTSHVGYQPMDVWMTINIYRAILAFLVFLSLIELGDGVVLQGITRLTHGVR